MFPFHSWNASVAQWIEQCPPEACAAVRLRSDAVFFIKEKMLHGSVRQFVEHLFFYKRLIFFFII